MPKALAKRDGIVTVAQAEERHRNEWVLMEVTHTDRVGSPRKGRIVAHSSDKKTAVEAGLELRKRDSQAHICLFYAGPVIPEGINVVL